MSRTPYPTFAEIYVRMRRLEVELDEMTRARNVLQAVLAARDAHEENMRQLQKADDENKN